MTPYQYNRHVAQPDPRMFIALVLAATMLVVLALSTSAMRRSNADWPAEPTPTPEPAPDMAPTVALSIHLG
jgi:hypothetical protein